MCEIYLKSTGNEVIPSLKMSQKSLETTYDTESFFSKVANCKQVNLVKNDSTVDFLFLTNVPIL